MGRKLDVSFDIEALGKTPHGVILSIGAVKFDRRDFPLLVKDEFYVNIKVGSSIREGMTVDDDVCEWWFDQPLEAMRALTKDPRLDLREALSQFAAFCKDCYLWSHQTHDTFMVLGNLERLGIDQTLTHYRNMRDLRTLYDLAGGRPERKGPKAHIALDDARVQAEEIVECFRRLREAA